MLVRRQVTLNIHLYKGQGHMDKLHLMVTSIFAVKRSRIEICLNNFLSPPAVKSSTQHKALVEIMKTVINNI